MTTLNPVHFLSAFFAASYLLMMTHGGFNLLSPEESLSFIFNYEYLAILDGNFDLPLRTLRQEGHFKPDGSAYSYFGMLSTFLRAPFSPFIDLTTHTPARFYVWLFSSASAWMLAWLFTKQVSIFPVFQRLCWQIALLLMVWVAAPMVLLTNAAPVYHEPIALGFFLTTASLALTLALEERALRLPYLLCLACLAGLCVHSRPSLAVGLYTLVCSLTAIAIFSNWRRRQTSVGVSLGQVASPIIAVVILSAFGVLYLAINNLKFGGALKLQGGASGDLVYGQVFLGITTFEDSANLRSMEWGVFNPLRILPNASFYLTGNSTLQRFLSELFGSGYVRLEMPFGVSTKLFLPWFALVAAGTVMLTARLRLQPISPLFTTRNLIWLAVFFAVCVQALLILSYRTVTTRYAAEFFPLILVLGFFSLKLFVNPVLQSSVKLAAVALLVYALCLAFVIINLGAFLPKYRYYWPDKPVVSLSQCLDLIQKSPHRDVLSKESCDL